MTHLPSRVSLAALLLAVTLPFLGTHHAYPLPTFYQEWLAVLLGLLALVPLIGTRDARPWPLPRIAALPLAMIVVLWTQPLLGIDTVHESTLLYSLYLGWAFVLVAATSRIDADLGSESLADVFAWTLLVGALLVAASGIAQRWAPGIGMPWVYRGQVSLAITYGNVAQGNNFADYLWLGIVAAAYLFARNRLRMPAAVPAVIVLMALSLLSGSRSVYFYALATTLWSAVWAWRSGPETRRRLLRVALLLLPALFATQVVLEAIGTPVASAQRVASQGSYDPVRLTLWRAAVDIFLDHPLLGAGIDSFSREFFQRIDRFPINGVGIPEHSHNLFFEVLAETGLAGIAALVTCTVLWLRSLELRNGAPAAFLALGLLCVLGLHSALEYPLWYAHFLAIAAIALTLGDRHRHTWQMRPLHRLVAGTMIVAGTVTLLTLRSDYAELEAVTIERRADGSPLESGEVMERLTRLYADSLLRPYATLHFAARIPLSTDDLKTRLAIVQEATHFSPIRQAVFLEAAMLHLDGQTEAARQQMHRAMLAYPAEIPVAKALLESDEALRQSLASLLAQLDQRSF